MSDDTPKDKGGHQSTYTPEMGERICDLVVEGLTLAEIEALPDMPRERTILRWAHRHADFGQLYTRAREASAHAFAERVPQIAQQLARGTLRQDDGQPVTAEIAKVVIDAAKWTAGRRNPRVWGDKAEHVMTAGDGWGEVMAKAGVVSVFPKASGDGA